LKKLESHLVEFKREWKDEFLKEVCAFANSDGGTIFIGMDKNGNPIGVKNPEKLLEDLPNKIRDVLSMTVMVKLEEIEGKKIIKLEVPSSSIPVSYNGKFYVRTGSTKQELKGVELLRFIMRKQNTSWDSLPSEIGIDKVDGETLDMFIEMAKDRLPVSRKDTTEKILESLELVKDGKLTNAAVLLFTKNPQKYFKNAFVRIGRFKTPVDIIDSVEIEGNLFKQLDEMIKVIKRHISVRYEIKDIRREDVWEYPLEAIREASINALIHREYLSSEDIQIKIYDDRIWFWNPGKLPEGLNTEMLRKEHPSKLRNKLIAFVFYYAGLIEKWGTGTIRMISWCRRYGLPDPEFVEEFGGFSVRFWKDIYNKEHLKKLNLNERQIKAVLYVKREGEITNKKYQEINNVSKRTATNDLAELVRLNIFLQVGTTGKGTKYVLNMNPQRGKRGI